LRNPAPLPCSVYVPADHVADPVAPVLPASPFNHGSGRLLKLGMNATLSNVEVFRTDVLWLVTTNPALTHPSPAFIPTKSGSAVPICVHWAPSEEM
jgi:hypothetical protein